MGGNLLNTFDTRTFYDKRSVGIGAARVSGVASSESADGIMGNPHEKIFEVDRAMLSESFDDEAAPLAERYTASLMSLDSSVRNIYNRLTTVAEKMLAVDPGAITNETLDGYKDEMTSIQKDLQSSSLYASEGELREVNTQIEEAFSGLTALYDQVAPAVVDSAPVVDAPVLKMSGSLAAESLAPADSDAAALAATGITTTNVDESLKVLSGDLTTTFADLDGYLGRDTTGEVIADPVVVESTDPVPTKTTDPVLAEIKVEPVVIETTDPVLTKTQLQPISSELSIAQPVLSEQIAVVDADTSLAVEPVVGTGSVNTGWGGTGGTSAVEATPVLVNTEESSIQQNGKVLGLDDGSYVVAYESDRLDRNGNSIALQMFDADGNKVGDEVQVNTTTRGDQEDVTLTKLDDGGFLVTYETERSKGEDGIAVQRFDATGAKVGAELSINSAAEDSLDDVEILALEGGGFVAKYEGGSNTYVQAYDANNQVLGREQNYGETEAVDVVATGGGGFAVALQDEDTFGKDMKRDLMMIGFDATGSATRKSMITDSAKGDQMDLQLTSLEGGGFVATYIQKDAESNGTFAKVFDATGAAVGSEIRLSTETESDVSIAALADGGFVAAYTKDDGDGVYAQRFDAKGTVVADEFQVNTTTKGDQGKVLVKGTDNGYAVVYESTDQTDLRVQHYNLADEAFGDERVLLTAEQYNDSKDVLEGAVDAVGNDIAVAYNGIDSSSGGVWLNTVAGPTAGVSPDPTDGDGAADDDDTVGDGGGIDGDGGGTTTGTSSELAGSISKQLTAINTTMAEGVDSQATAQEIYNRLTNLTDDVDRLAAEESFSEDEAAKLKAMKDNLLTQRDTLDSFVVTEEQQLTNLEQQNGLIGIARNLNEAASLLEAETDPNQGAEIRFEGQRPALERVYKAPAESKTEQLSKDILAAANKNEVMRSQFKAQFVVSGEGDDIQVVMNRDVSDILNVVHQKKDVLGKAVKNERQEALRRSVMNNLSVAGGLADESVKAATAAAAVAPLSLAGGLQGSLSDMKPVQKLRHRIRISGGLTA